MEEKMNEEQSLEDGQREEDDIDYVEDREELTEERIKDMLDAREYKELKEELETNMYPVDLAEILEEFDQKHMVLVFRLLAKEEAAVETIKEAVRSIRNIRSEMNVAPSNKAKVFVESDDANIREIFENGNVFFATLGYASEVIIQDNKDGIGDDAVSSVIAGAVIYMPFAELDDIAKEKERLAKEEKR